jgi:hypothetical protein
MIASTELTHNYERLNTPYDPNQPIEMLFQQIQDVRAFTVAGGQPYGNAMIVNVVFTLVFNTGLFPDACHTWQARATAEKTWPQLKVDFATVYREFRLTNQTAHQSGFHSANMMIEHSHEGTLKCTTDDIAQLKMATTSDRGTMATLTATNAKLTSQLKVSQAYTKKLKEEITDLKTNMKPA